MIPEDILEAAYKMLPPTALERAEVVERSEGQTPFLLVWGDLSWLDWLPPSRLGRDRKGIKICGYDLGPAYLLVHMDCRPHGEA